MIFVFCQVVQEVSKNKVSFDFLLSWQHLCQKLSKSVDADQSYSKPKQCRFLRHSVDDTAKQRVQSNDRPRFNHTDTDHRLHSTMGSR